MTFKSLYHHPKLRGAVRVFWFLAAVNIAITAFFFPQARAQAEEAAKRTGLMLLQQIGPTLVGPPEVLSINGQRMSLASKLTPLSVEQVLARFEQHCREHSGDLAREIATMPAAERALGQLPPELRDPSKWLTSRQVSQDGKAGQLACIARKDSGGGMQGLVDRIVKFTDSGDLAEIGDARYVVARKDEASGQTHVLAMWTEGSFNIPAMFPDEGDAPGSDSTAAPRPPASRRVLSADISNKSYGIRMYDTQQTHEQVQAFYAEMMKARGFALHPLPNQDSELDLNEHVQAFAKNGAAIIVVVHQTPAEQTGVSLIEMGSLGFAKASAGDAE